MANQKQHWNDLHYEGNIDRFASKPTAFALEVIRMFTPSSTILELGCGAGNDSAFFAQNDYTVTATDFSEVAIEKNRTRYKHIRNLSFEVLDMSMSMCFSKDQFDVVYARLSLHYFTDEITQKLYNEIHRVLKPKGLFCFLCKSVNDPLYGKGKEIEKDMFEYKGHVRHFFSEKYAKKCLGNFFSIEKIESGPDIFYGKESAFIKSVARKM